MNGVTIALLLSLLTASVRAEEASVAILNGRWTYDAARSTVVVPDLQITKAANGTLHAWLVAGKKKEIVLETSTVTLHGDELKTVKHGKLPDGSPYERTVTYRRDGHGEGLVGLWRSTKVDTGSTWDGFDVSTTPDGVVTWRIPTDLQVITGRFDGSDLPLVGPKGPTGSTMAWRADGPRRFAYVGKDGGQISQRGTITISPDGHRLTEITWDVDQPDRKSKLVYERDR